MALTPIQHLAVKYLAAGWSVPKTAAELKLPPGSVRKWHNEPLFLEALRAATVEHAELIEAMLLVGEREAAKTMIDALSAQTKNGEPAWQIRVTAAMNLLDRKGNRGKAIDRQQVASVNTEIKATGDVEGALRNALRDPGVRAWLKETNGLATYLTGAETEDAVIIPEPDDLVSPPLLLAEGE